MEKPNRERVNIKLLVEFKKSTTETLQMLTEANGEETLSGAWMEPLLPQLKKFRKNGESPEGPPKTLVPELLLAIAIPNAEVCEC
ncbi:hypothetical protein TNCV_2595151 [Trichonephila clavipes]|nr:hypothetical protein TNCV_2595151 [Trichonephila clavipes]